MKEVIMTGQRNLQPRLDMLERDIPET